MTGLTIGSHHIAAADEVVHSGSASCHPGVRQHRPQPAGSASCRKVLFSAQIETQHGLIEASQRCLAKMPEVAATVLFKRMVFCRLRTFVVTPHSKKLFLSAVSVPFQFGADPLDVASIPVLKSWLMFWR
jgi:hypothetical protein